MQLIDITPNDEKWYDLKDLPNEEWKDIKGYDGLYQISNYGRVKILEKTIYSKRYNTTGRYYNEKILKCTRNNNNNYLNVQLFRNGLFKTKRIHRLVALAFIPNPDNKPQVNHIDGDKTNNNVNNLEWCTNGENGQHAWDNNLRTRNFGKNNYASKKIIQYTIDGEFVKERDSIADICKELPSCCSVIIDCCKKRTKSSHGYVWKYKEEINNGMEI